MIQTLIPCCIFCFLGETRHLSIEEHIFLLNRKPIIVNNNPHIKSNSLQLLKRPRNTRKPIKRKFIDNTLDCILAKF